MNWINTAENLGITLVSFIVGALMGAFITVQVTKTIIDSNQKVLIEAIHKETTAINNDYDIKNKKGVLDLKSINDISKDTTKKEKWLKRLLK